jgi:hypothetical protein
MKRYLLVQLAVLLYAFATAQTAKRVDPKPLYLKTLTTLTETLYRLQQKDSLQKAKSARHTFSGVKMLS